MSKLILSFQASEGELLYVLIVVLIFIVGIIIFFYFSDKNRILRKLKAVSSKKISLTKENEYVKIIGKARPYEEPMVSPIGKRKCVYYQIEVKQKGNKNSWRTILKDEKFEKFILESKGENAIVTPLAGNRTKLVYLEKDVKLRSGTWNDAPQHLEKYLNTKGESSEGFLGFNKALKYREGVIEIGEEISVMGIGNWKESDHNFDRYSSKTLFLTGTKTNKLLITDDPKATHKT